MKFTIFIGLLLVLCRGSFSQDNVTETETEEESYLDVFIRVQQFESLVKRFVCQIVDFDDDELFTEPSTCFDHNNFTEEQCRGKRCCYVEEANEDGSAGCFKTQTYPYVYSKLEESGITLRDDEESGKKQSSIVTDVSEFITCVITGNVNCQLTFGSFSASQLSALILAALSGDQAAVTMLVSFGENFVAGLLTDNLITQTQADQLLTLFTLATLTPPVITVGPPIIIPSPTPPIILPPVPPFQRRCFWYPWSGWSNCEGICGVGIQTRFRRCQGFPELQCFPGEGNCQGPCNQKRNCPNPVGQICGYWSFWSEYGVCSTTCGQGVRTRTRTCSGRLINEAACPGEGTQTIPCNGGPGGFLPWTAYTACSVTCGTGFQTRQRFHTCDLPGETDRRTCNQPPCCSSLPWTQWSSCSTTCGRGTRTRSRLDICPEIPAIIDSEVCNVGFGNWGDWSPWGACSLTCPGGIRSRSRGNPCIADPEVETQPCGQPGFLTQWTNFGDCSSSCPDGVRERIRRNTCTSENFRETQSCGQLEPSFGPWTDFGPCSASCEGRRVRQAFDPCGGPPMRDEAACGSNEFWALWGPWSICSQTCLGGSQSRSRTQPCTGLADTETQPCGSPGSWGIYSEWSSCDAPCGGGRQFRSRIHSCPNGLPIDETSPQQEVRACNVQPCCTFGLWSLWSDCQASCNYGVVIRRQRSSCPNIEDRVQRRFCFNTRGNYTEWSQWTGCSQTCPGGQRRRTRLQTCLGITDEQVQVCGNAVTNTPWTPFSDCTRTCGGGMQSRTRSNACDLTFIERENRACNTDPGFYNPPSSWTVCSTLCFGGTRTRISTHTCGLPNRVEEEPCGIAGTFLPWLSWGACSSTCGGVRTRMRRHQCTNEIEEGSEPCGGGGEFLPWSVWTVCSDVCAGGTRTRTRLHTCLGRTTDTEQCGRAPFLENWTFWGPCSRTCGTGQQIRTRSGFCGAQDQTESRNCATSPCCFVEPWQNWGPCSVSCGIGQQSRQRFSNCSPLVPVDTEVRNCNAGNGITSQWSQWTACSRTCAGGDQTRSRTNTCSDLPQVQQRECNNINCPAWTPWTPFTACSASCFGGVQTRTRRCVGGIAGVDCLGPATDSIDCDAGSGSWSLWSLWTICSASCDGGIRTRTRTNICGLPVDTQSAACNTFRGEWSLWSLWTICTRTCGSGTQSRQRTQSCTNDVDRAARACNTDPGTWTLWTAWSVCSATCGGGTYTRRRSHTCGLPDEAETAFCNTFAGDFLPWTLWSACSATCGAGTQVRRRSHTCGLPDEVESGACTAGACQFWSAWIAWGACSNSCGVGVRIRTRQCLTGVLGQPGIIGQPGCIGEFRQQLTCESIREDVPWTEFGPCSVTCGGGFMTRQRVDPCAPAPEEDIRVCNTFPGSWTLWTLWSGCPVTCGTGRISRRRSHTCGLPDQFETANCNVNLGSWTLWSTWGACSATCGFGTRTRISTQTCTGETRDETETCSLNPCAIWGGWTTWGSCTASCGEGTSIRTRLCQGGRPGEGFCFTSVVGAVDTRVCNAGECCDFAWSGWSACCRTVNPPPPAIQIRFLGNGCGEPWQRDVRDCPPGVRVESIPCTDLNRLFELADESRAFIEFLERGIATGQVRSRAEVVESEEI